MRIISAAGILALVSAVLFFAFKKQSPENTPLAAESPKPTSKGQVFEENLSAQEEEERAARQKELEKLWKGLREFGNITRIRTGNCWLGQYIFNNPKNVVLSNQEWETLIKIFCYLQGQEYQCEQLTTMESPISKEAFVSLLSEETTIKLLGDELLKAIRYDTEREIEYHGNTLSKLPSVALLEKKFDVLAQESVNCDSDE